MHTPVPFVHIPSILEGINADPEASMYGSYFTRNTGQHFEAFAAMSDPKRFEASDLIAIEALSVRLHPHGARRLLLDAEFGERCTVLLREIPVEVPLHDVDASVIGPDSYAQKLWRLLRELHGMGRGLTVISKLMAAKRPLLFPIWDTKVAALISAPDGDHWRAMHELVTDRSARKRIEKATTDAPQHVGLLRRIDVALWRHATLVTE